MKVHGSLKARYSEVSKRNGGTLRREEVLYKGNVQYLAEKAKKCTEI